MSHVRLYHTWASGNLFAMFCIFEINTKLMVSCITWHQRRRSPCWPRAWQSWTWASSWICSWCRVGAAGRWRWDTQTSHPGPHPSCPDTRCPDACAPHPAATRWSHWPSSPAAQFLTCPASAVVRLLSRRYLKCGKQQTIIYFMKYVF